MEVATTIKVNGNKMSYVLNLKCIVLLLLLLLIIIIIMIIYK